VGDALAAVAERLRAAGVETPHVDAEILVAHVLGVPRATLAVDRAQPLRSEEQKALESLAARRAAREPLQYVLGEWGFRRLTLRVDPRALIPRPETEVTVERALAAISRLQAPSVLDVGVGSGAIALAIADEHPRARVVGIDSSAKALQLARENALRCELDVELRRHDLLSGLPPGPWDLAVANPPYVLEAERNGLAPEVRDWEPAEALFEHGETDAIARSAIDVLAPGGALVLEVGTPRAGEVAALLRELGYRDVEVTPDLAGRDRVVEGRR
jgi:release factor glutamine methyltransferase